MALRDVPAVVRPAMAAAETAAEANRLREKYRGKGDDEARRELARDRMVSVRYGGASLAGVHVPGWD